MGHSVQVGLRLGHGLFTQSYRRRPIIWALKRVYGWGIGISLVVASTCIAKWEIKHPAENQEGEDWDERLKREEEVYDIHLKGPKSEPTKGIWWNCLGY